MLFINKLLILLKEYQEIIENKQKHSENLTILLHSIASFIVTVENSNLTYRGFKRWIKGM